MSFNFTDAPVTLLLLIANVLVSGYTLFSDPSLLDRLGFQPRRIREQGEYYRFITAGFVHAGLAHLAFNMVTLYFAGPLLEMLLGSRDFFLLYFGSELLAHGVTYWFQRDNDGYNAVGASGAISGVIFAYVLFNPFGTIYLFFALPMQIWLFAILYVGGSIYAMRRAKQEGRVGGIAHEAHLGGALGGIVLTIILEPRILPYFIGQLF